ncbi:hypothetical protein [Streptomyces sp. AC558_RSS880]|uniref:hypothetical protein n=1 Tax=Streptomyces sp. AC558_RSS880 TaxID=2823687 RepID=UPI001C224087|nr:hypothetical protein [Streptomyces sp. AC558_RSS880]
MPTPSETPRNRAGLPIVDLAAARELFRTAGSSGLGRPGTDGIFDQWLDESCDLAFHRGADRPSQARAVDQEGVRGHVRPVGAAEPGRDPARVSGAVRDSPGHREVLAVAARTRAVFLSHERRERTSRPCLT